ncbi:MAG: TatD family deoxyribonuclease, partial [Actinobacteria bacterium]|nr:TatD family deoxyribonuclease [Actinomycetota bacterium]
VRAIGETGLDFFRTEGEEALKLQQHSFEQHIEIAKENSIAMQIHDREAHEEVVKTLLRVGAPEKTVFHCFSGDVELVEIAKKNGWYISFAGNISFKKNQYLRDALLACEPWQVLIETDAPFLTPEPMRGRPNAPYLVPHTLRFMAEVLGQSPEELATQINKNTEAVYGPWSEDS